MDINHITLLEETVWPRNHVKNCVFFLPVEFIFPLYRLILIYKYYIWMKKNILFLNISIGNFKTSWGSSFLSTSFICFKPLLFVYLCILLYSNKWQIKQTVTFHCLGSLLGRILIWFRCFLNSNITICNSKGTSKCSHTDRVSPKLYKQKQK